MSTPSYLPREYAPPDFPGYLYPGNLGAGQQAIVKVFDARGTEGRPAQMFETGNLFVGLSAHIGPAGTEPALELCTAGGGPWRREGAGLLNQVCDAFARGALRASVLRGHGSALVEKYLPGYEDCAGAEVSLQGPWGEVALMRLTPASVEQTEPLSPLWLAFDALELARAVALAVSAGTLAIRRA